MGNKYVDGIYVYSKTREINEEAEEWCRKVIGEVASVKAKFKQIKCDIKNVNIWEGNKNIILYINIIVYNNKDINEDSFNELKDNLLKLDKKSVNKQSNVVMYINDIGDGIIFDDKTLEKYYKFAQGMKGKHNPDMIFKRNHWNIFRDDFRGKLGEEALVRYIELTNETLKINERIDTSISDRGVWDNTDLIVEKKYISVKSIRENSNFLLIEANRYEKNGNHKYKNNDGNSVKVDYYALVRVNINPDILKSQAEIIEKYEKLVKDKGSRDEADKFWSEPEDSIFKLTWKEFKINKNIEIYAEILGFISHQDFWKNKGFAPAGIRCDGKNLKDIADAKENIIPKNKLRKPLSTDSSNYILQVDNYVINSKDMINLDKVFQS